MSILKANRIENLTTTDGGINVNNSGNVGIGTTSPARPLSVLSSQISARFTSSSSDSQIEVVDSSGTVVYGSASGNAIIQAGGSERLRIDSSGRLLVGATSAAIGSRMDVHAGSDGANIFGVTGADQSSEFLALGVTSSEAILTAGNAGSNGTSLVIRTANSSGAESERMRIDSSGNVGIGTTSPGDQLHIHTASSGAANVRFSSTDVPNGFFVGFDGQEQAQIWHTANKPIRFATNNTERMRLTDNGLTFNGDTSSANALGDYEQGTFTPIYLAGLSSPSYSDTTGTYTKIGNLVTFTLRISASGTNVGSHARIGSLPFTSSGSRDEGSASFGFFGNLTGSGSADVYLHIPVGSNNIEFYSADGNQFLGNSGAGLSGKTLHIRGFYYV